MTRQTGPCWSSWMSSGTTLVYPTSFFLVLVCVPVTPDNEVTWWSVAFVAGRRGMQKTTWHSVLFTRVRCSVCNTIHASSWAHNGLCPSSHPLPQAWEHTAPMSIHGPGLCCKIMGRSGIANGLASASSVWLMGSSPMPTSHDLGFWRLLRWTMRQQMSPWGLWVML